MTTAADWTGRVGDVWAAEWRRTDRSFADLSRHLDRAILGAAPDRPFRALDIGCGAGATGLALAAARPDAQVVGVDLSAGLIAVARERGDKLANCRFEHGDALAAAAAVRPDLIVSRHGVMFFADPAAALTGLRAAAAPGAALVSSCFGPRAANRFATLADELAGVAATTTTSGPGPFAFANSDRVAALLEQAGWAASAPMPVDFAYRVGAGPDAIGDAVGFLSRIGPVAGALRVAPDRAALEAALAGFLACYRTGDAIDLPATAWIWHARTD